MSYYPKGHRHRGDEVDDFDAYDPDPYSGGCNLTFTYGHPLLPTHEICHPPRPIISLDHLPSDIDHKEEKFVKLSSVSSSFGRHCSLSSPASIISHHHLPSGTDHKEEKWGIIRLVQQDGKSGGFLELFGVQRTVVKKHGLSSLKQFLHPKGRKETTYQSRKASESECSSSSSEDSSSDDAEESESKRPKSRSGRKKKDWKHRS